MDVPPIPGTVYRELVQYATVFKDSKEKNALSPLFEDIDDLIDLETKHDSFLERLYSKYIHAAVGPEKSLLDVDAQRLSVRPSEPAQTDESSTTATVDIAPTPACGHVFKRGEGIYRCRDCGADETCVMCTRCFHGTKHEGHDVIFSISAGAGGCCDCGDHEAWKIDNMNCPYHYGTNRPPPTAPFEENSNYSPSAQGASRDAIEALDSFIDEALHFVLIQLGTWFFDASTPENWSLREKLPSASSLESQDPVSVVLWNDESHSFQDVIDQVKQATGYDSAYGKMVAEIVDGHGRCLVKSNLKPQLALRVARALTHISLSVTFRNLNSFNLEEMCGVIISWLKQKASESLIIRNCICKTLLQRIKTNLPAWLWEVDPTRAQLFREHFLDFIEQQNSVSSLLDFLFFVDIKLWKTIRLGLRELYIVSLLSDTDAKKELAIRFADNYVALANGYLEFDREPEMNIVFFSVQVFTTPSLATLLATRDLTPHEFPDALLDLIRNYLVKDNPAVPGINLNPVKCDSERFGNRRYFHFFHDCRYFLQTESVRAYLSENAERRGCLIQRMINFLEVFAGMDSNKREVGSHVEYENNSWINAFNLSFTVAQNTSCFVDALAYDKTCQALIDLIRRCLPAVIRLFKIDRMRTLEDMIPLGVFKVSRDPVSFHNTIHCLVGHALKYLYRLNASFGFKNWESVLDSELAPTNLAALLLLDAPLRLRSLFAQIRAGLWVRNGYSIRNQVYNYRSVSLREETFDIDLFLIQAMTTFIKPDDFVLMLTDRFEVAAALKLDYQNDFDPSQMVILLEEFLLLFIHILTVRDEISSISLEERIHIELVQSLCLGSRSYSDLTKTISDSLVEHPSFDTILRSLAHFKFPEGISEHGVYEIRHEYLCEYNPYFYHHGRKENEAGIAYVLQRLKSKDPVIESVPPRNPSLLSIAPTSPFSIFSKLVTCEQFLNALFFVIYHVIRMSSENSQAPKSDILLDECLYLIQIATAIEPDNFVEACSTLPIITNDTEVTLLDQLLRLARNDAFEDHKSRLELVFQSFDSNINANEKLQAWRNEKQDHEKLIQEQDVANRRQAALERQRKLMAEFASAQVAFAENHADLYEQVDSEEETGVECKDVMDVEITENADKLQAESKLRLNNWQLPSGTCILCQETLGPQKCDYGAIGFCQESTGVRKWNPSSCRIQHLIDGFPKPVSKDATPVMLSPILPRISHYRSDVGLMMEQQQPESNLHELQSLPSFDCNSRSVQNAVVVNTCGHLIHYRCHERYMDSVRQNSMRFILNAQNGINFLCPLCKQQSNVVVPALATEKMTVPLTGDGVLYDTFDQWFTVGLKRLSEDLQSESTTKDVLASNLPGSPIENVEDRRLRLANLHVQLGSTWRKPVLDDPNFESIRTKLFDLDYEYHSVAEEELVILGNLFDSHLNNVCLGTSWHRPWFKEPWHLLCDTISSLEVAQRDLHWQDTPFHQQAPSSNIETVLQLLSRLQDVSLDEIAKEPLISERMSTTANLLRFFEGDNSSEVHIYDPFEATCLVLTDSIIRRHSSGLANRTHILQWFFSLECIRAVITLFGPDTDYESVIEDVGVVENPSTSSLVNFVANTVNTFLSALQSAKLPFRGDFKFLDPQAIANRVGNMYVDKYRNFCQSISLLNQDRLRIVLERLLLPYLRRTSLLLYTAIGLEEPGVDSGPFSEFNLLCQHIGVSLDVTLDLYNGSQNLSNLASSACIQLGQLYNMQLTWKMCNLDALVRSCPELNANASEDIWKQSTNMCSRLLMTHPLPYVLAKLPSKMESLLEGLTEVRCKNCGGCPPDPALCLVCGEIVCAHSYCCSTESGSGECFLHSLSCGAGVGIFLLVKRCVVLLLDGPKGCILNAPYIDAHGEVDIGLKRGRPLYLYPKRYNEFRKIWLKHEISTTVARLADQTNDISDWRHF